MVTPSVDLEPAIRRLAHEIASASPRPVDGRLDRFVVERVLADPDVKTKLFHLVDVYPALSDDDEVLLHLRDQLDQPSVPATLRRAVRAVQRLPAGGRVARGAANLGIRRMASRFIAGADVAAALPALEQLWRLRAGVILDLLGEKTVAEKDADRYAARLASEVGIAVAAARTWQARRNLEHDQHGPVARLAVAVKPTALAPTYQVRTAERGIEEARRRLLPILEQAAADRVAVWIDMEHHAVKELTLELARRLLAEPSLAELQLGVVVQAYLRSAEHDVAEVLDMAGSRPLGVRLVKGAYWDMEVAVARANGWPVPVWTDKAATDLCFERCTRTILDHAQTIRPAIASHNLRSVAHALAYAEAVGLPARAVELQVLYGMGADLMAGLVHLGQRVRVYTPVGPLVPGMAYLVRRLLENTANESFVRQRLDHDLDALLAPPVVGDG